LGSAEQYCADPTYRRHPPTSEGTRPGIVPNAMGTHTVMVEGLIGRCPDDQHTVGNSGREASVPRCYEIPQVPDSCGRVFASGRELEKPSSRTALKSMEESGSDSPDCGSGGKTQAANGCRPAPF
jgi:hypothetical protein